jgi:hypothetical protein
MQAQPRKPCVSGCNSEAVQIPYLHSVITFVLVVEKVGQSFHPGPLKLAPTEREGTRTRTRLGCVSTARIGA